MNQHTNQPAGAKTASQVAHLFTPFIVLVRARVCVCVRTFHRAPQESDPPSALHQVSRYLPPPHRISRRRTDALLPSNRLHQVQEKRIVAVLKSDGLRV